MENESFCFTQVFLTTDSITPSAGLNFCGIDTLFLFADTMVIPPGADTAFAYLWTGPNGFGSSEMNPFIENVDSRNSGTYYLTMTGLTGCMSTDSIELEITDTPGNSGA